MTKTSAQNVTFWYIGPFQIALTNSRYEVRLHGSYMVSPQTLEECVEYILLQQGWACEGLGAVTHAMTTIIK